MKRKKGQGYPKNWPAIAKKVKDSAKWKCERCKRDHNPKQGYCLTVHHLDGIKMNCELWNLAALCQRCHLAIQGRVVFMQDYFGDHTPWMKLHVKAHNRWAKENGKPLLTCF